MLQSVFAAGIESERRGWDDPVLVDAGGVEEQTPQGPPLIVTVEQGEVSTQLVQTLAALHGAGRKVLLVTDARPPDDMAAWLPPGALHVLGEPSDVPETLPDEQDSTRPPNGDDELVASGEDSHDEGQARTDSSTSGLHDQQGRQMSLSEYAADAGQARNYFITWSMGAALQGLMDGSLIPADPELHLGLDGFFNVEGGWAAVSVGEFDHCECAAPPMADMLSDSGPFAYGTGAVCPSCGRSVGNTVAVMAGTGDGTYPVQMWRSATGEVLGVTAWFATAMGQQAPRIANMGLLSELFVFFDELDVVPVVLGGLASTGQLFFSDVSGGPYTLAVSCPADDYLVVGWATTDVARGLPPEYSMMSGGPRIQALTAVRGGLRASMETRLADVGADHSALREEILRATTDPMLVSSSHRVPEADRARDFTEHVRAGGTID